MESLEARIEKIEYYQKLLLEMMGNEKYPFFEFIIKNNLTEKDVKEIIDVCEEVSKKYEEQKEEGYVFFDSLLTHFIGMLNNKVDPKETIVALFNQKMYKPLMSKLCEIMLGKN